MATNRVRYAVSAGAAWLLCVCVASAGTHECRTVADIAAAIRAMQPGDDVHVVAGEYVATPDNPWVFDVPRFAGDASNPVVVEFDKGAVIRADVPNGVGIYLGSAKGGVVSGMKFIAPVVYDARLAGIWVRNSHDITVDHAFVDGTTREGVTPTGKGLYITGDSFNVLVSNGEFRECDQGGRIGANPFTPPQPHDIRVEWCRFNFNCGPRPQDSDGLQVVGPGTRNVVVFRCVMDFNADDGGDFGQGASVEVRQCVARGNKGSNGFKFGTHDAGNLSPMIVCIGNDAFDNATCGFGFTGARANETPPIGPWLVRNNRAVGNGLDGFQFDRCHVVVKGNQADAPGPYWPFRVRGTDGSIKASGNVSLTEGKSGVKMEDGTIVEGSK